jgi:hypothetical protein
MTDAEVETLHIEARSFLKRGRRIPPKLAARMNVCNECEQPRREHYMLRNDLWQIVNPVRHGHLCLSCLQRRAKERLGRRLRQSDFGPDGVIDEDGNAISLR